MVNTLELYDNHIKEIGLTNTNLSKFSEVFKNLPSLEVLRLKNIEIPDKEAKLFSHLDSLKQLYFVEEINSGNVVESTDNTKIKASSTFKSLPELERLYLHGVKLTDVKPELLDSLVKLKELSMSNNKVDKFPLLF